MSSSSNLFKPNIIKHFFCDNLENLFWQLRYAHSVGLMMQVLSEYTRALETLFLEFGRVEAELFTFMAYTRSISCHYLKRAISVQHLTSEG